MALYQRYVSFFDGKAQVPCAGWMQIIVVRTDSMQDRSQFFVVKKKAVPEVLLKVVEPKRLLETGKACGLEGVVLESHKNWIKKDPVKSLEMSALWLKERC